MNACESNFNLRLSVIQIYLVQTGRFSSYEIIILYLISFSLMADSFSTSLVKDHKSESKHELALARFGNLFRLMRGNALDNESVDRRLKSRDVQINFIYF